MRTRRLFAALAVATLVTAPVALASTSAFADPALSADDVSVAYPAPAPVALSGTDAQFGDTVSVSVDDSSACVATVLVGGGWSCDSDAKYPLGIHDIVAQEFSAQEPVGTSATATLTVYVAAPTITDETASTADVDGTLSVHGTATTDDGEITVVVDNTDDVYGCSTEAITGGAWSCDIDLTGLEPSGAEQYYSLSATQFVEDGDASDVSEAGTWRFTIAEPDLGEPELSCDYSPGSVDVSTGSSDDVWVQLFFVSSGTDEGEGAGGEGYVPENLGHCNGEAAAVSPPADAVYSERGESCTISSEGDCDFGDLALGAGIWNIYYGFGTSDGESSSSDSYDFYFEVPETPTVSTSSTSTTVTVSGEAASGSSVSVTSDGDVVCTTIATANGYSCPVATADPDAHDYAAYATDTASGGVSGLSESVSAQEQWVTPTITKPAAKATVSSLVAPTFEGTASAGALVDVAVDDEVVCTVESVPSSGTWSCTPESTLEPGTHTAIATARWSESTPLASAPRTFTAADPDAVVVSSPTDGSVVASRGSLTVRGFAGLGVDVRVYIGEGTACSTTASASTGAFSCVITGLTTTQSLSLYVVGGERSTSLSVGVVSTPVVDGAANGTITSSTATAAVSGTAWFEADRGPSSWAPFDPSAIAFADGLGTDVECRVYSGSTRVATTDTTASDIDGSYSCALPALDNATYRLAVVQRPTWADGYSLEQSRIALVIAAPVTTPAPTPTPTPSPSDEPTDEPSPTPTPSESETPTPTPTPTDSLPEDWTFELEGVDGPLHPNDPVHIHADDLPPGTLATAELHSDPIVLGSSVVGDDGILDLDVVVPETVEPGDHHIVLVITPPGGTPQSVEQPVTIDPAPVVVTGTPTPRDPNASGGGDNTGGSGAAGGSVDRSATAPTALTAAIPTVLDIVGKPGNIAAASAVALAILLLVAIPTELLNSTLSSNTERFGRGFEVFSRRFNGVFEWLGRVTRTQFVPAAVLIVLTSLVFGFVDPSFGLNPASGRMVLSLAIALLIVTFGASRITAAILGRSGIASRIEMQPVMLVFAIVGVIVARLLGFAPGFLIGLVIGIELAHQATARERNRGAFVQMIVILSLGILGWLGVSLAAAVEGSASPTFLSQLVGDTLAAITSEGVTAAFIGLLPLGFLEGRELWERSKLTWGVLFLVVGAGFALLVLPTAAQGVEVTDIVFWIVVLVGFAIVTLSLWAVLRGIALRAERREHAESAESAHH